MLKGASKWQKRHLKNVISQPLRGIMRKNETLFKMDSKNLTQANTLLFWKVRGAKERGRRSQLRALVCAASKQSCAH